MAFDQTIDPCTATQVMGKDEHRLDGAFLPLQILHRQLKNYSSFTDKKIDGVVIII